MSGGNFFLYCKTNVCVPPEIHTSRTAEVGDYSQPVMAGISTSSYHAQVIQL